METRDVLLILLGSVMAILVINHPRVFELLVRTKADEIFDAAEKAIDDRALDRVLRALEET